MKYEVRNTKYEIKNLHRVNLKLALSIVYCLLSIVSFAQSDSVYRISLILPFQTESTVEKLDGFSNAHDFFTASRIHLNEDAVIALDFYEGALEALRETNDSFKVELKVYDCYNSDSVTTELLKKDDLKKSDVIIGAMSVSGSKLVADYCKQNKIINVQPFSPSKSLTADNPYHLKLSPTIDAHVDALFNSIIDSFAGGNIIIYTPDAEKSLSVAQRFDSLFRSYNKTALQKFTVALLNTKTMMVNGKKTTAAEQVKTDRPNIFIITSFEESFVNGNLRVLHDDLKTKRIIVYGMPTWLNGDILRLDYVNDFSTRISDAFYLDSARNETLSFKNNFKTNFSQEPSKFAFLGFDVFNFVLENLNDYGKDFINNVATQHFNGTGYKFDISKNSKDGKQVNYYENRNVAVFMVENYQLKRVK